MTLQDLFTLLSENNQYVLFFFLIIPVAAILAGILGRGEGHLSPWKYIYAAMIYLVSVPGLFAITLSVYLFLFERRSVLDLDIFTQVLPILSMVITIMIIRRQVNLDAIPGFDKLSGLMAMISAALIIMWIVDRTRILAFTFVRFEFVILVFVGLLLIIRFGWSRLMGN